jgi:hypothetical protein
MKIKLFTMVKNEVDIVVDWVFYHGAIFGYSNLYIIDNYSEDGTYEKLLKLKPLGINLNRKSDYAKKGLYMTWYYKNCCEPEDFAYPLDIDEFIVYYDKKNNKISVNKKKILEYFETLPNASIYKTAYIQATPNQDYKTGFNRATAECKWAFYDSNYRVDDNKSFIKRKLFNGTFDHGNHLPTNNYYFTDLCLVHFHVRNLKQMKKKIYCNVAGFGYPADNLLELKNLLDSNPTCAGNHHVCQHIKILEKTYELPCHAYDENSVNLTPLNDFVKKINA